MIQTENQLAAAVAKQVSSEVKPDEAAMKAFYEQNKGNFETAKASHILIRFTGSRVPLRPGQKELTEAEALAKAQAIRKQLADGGDFAAIAKAESDDTSNSGSAGSLGSFNRGQMVPEFDKVVFSMPVGLSDPVKTPFGYHIIKLEERKAKTYEEAKPYIEKQLKTQMGRDAIERLKKQTPATLDDNYFTK
jgi:parvulin-like peptidyl-prolyl isomerase